MLFQHFKICVALMGLVIMISTGISLNTMADDNERNESRPQHDLICPEVDMEKTATVVMTKTNQTPVILHIASAPSPLEEDVIGYSIQESETQVRLYFTQAIKEIPFPQSIHLVITDKLTAGLGGLYCPGKQLSQDSFTYFINPRSLQEPQTLTRLLAHELTHHYIHLLKLSLPDWLEEGLALLSEYRVRGRPSITAYTIHMKTPWTSLTDIHHDTLSVEDARYSQYGHAQLLMIYLFRQLNVEILSQVVRSRSGGIPFLNELARSYSGGHWHNFREAFRDFELAKYMNTTRYGKASDFDQRLYVMPVPYLKVEAEVAPPAELPWAARPVALNAQSSSCADSEDFWIGDIELNDYFPQKILAGQLPPPHASGRIRICY